MTTTRNSGRKSRTFIYLSVFACSLLFLFALHLILEHTRGHVITATNSLLDADSYRVVLKRRGDTFLSESTFLCDRFPNQRHTFEIWAEMRREGQLQRVSSHVHLPNGNDARDARVTSVDSYGIRIVYGVDSDVNLVWQN